MPPSNPGDGAPASPGPPHIPAPHHVAWSKRVDVHATLPSTMDEARRLALVHAPHGVTVVAETQTQGRGRRGSPWQSPPGAGLYATTVLYVRPTLALSAAACVLGLGCAEALRGLGAQVQLKWPNDLLVAGGKLGGLLLQQEAAGPTGCCLLFGLGLNLEAQALQPAFAAPGALPRTSLVEALGSQHSPSRDALLAALRTACEARFQGWLAEGLSAEMRATFDGLHALQNAQVSATDSEGRPLEGRVAGLASCGGLLLEAAGGPVILRAGAVHLLRPSAR